MARGLMSLLFQNTGTARNRARAADFTAKTAAFAPTVSGKPATQQEIDDFSRSFGHDPADINERIRGLRTRRRGGAQVIPSETLGPGTQVRRRGRRRTSLLSPVEGGVRKKTLLGR